MKILWYFLKELINNKYFSLLFVLNLSLGLTGFVSLEALKSSIDYAFQSRSKNVLGADFGVSARRPLSENEVKIVDENIGFSDSSNTNSIEKTKLLEFFSMVANFDGDSRLLQIRVIENNFPFYGDIKLTKLKKKNNQNFLNLEKENLIWVYPEILSQLKVSVGDRLKIGQAEFKITDTVEDDSGAGISTNMAPRIYMSFNSLQKTDLLKKGSIAWHSVLYKNSSLSLSKLNSQKDNIFSLLENPDIKVYTHKNVSEQMGRLVDYLNDFLGLASIVALFLSCIGAIYLFRSYLLKKISQIAILISLGVPHQRAFLLHFIQVAFLGLISALMSILFSLVTLPFFRSALSELVPFEIVLKYNLSSFVLCILLGTLGSLIVCLPLFLGIKNVKPSQLFYSNFTNKIKFDKWQVLSILPIGLVFWGLSVWLASSVKVGSLFTLLMFLAILSISGIALLFLYGIKYLRGSKNLSIKWAAQYMTKKKMESISIFLCIGIGILLLNLIPQIQKSLAYELESPDQSKIPSLFMFDIQEDQMENLKAQLKEKGHPLVLASPMIRARLIAVNKIKFDKGKGTKNSLSREEEKEMRFRNRGFNLSYRSSLEDAESITEGKPFTGVYDENSGLVSEVSVEKRFAKRLGLKIGDVLSFDVESIPIEGKIVNFRKVKWTSFQPNFFVLFQPGVLDLAPKTFVASTGNYSFETKNKIQNFIVDKYPNISIIDVSRLVERISGLIAQMSWALRLMSILCLLVGFIVIYSISSHVARSRSWEVGLLKSLGASFSNIRNQFLWQFTSITLVAGCFGIGICLLMSYLISAFLFEGVWVLDLWTPIISLIVSVIVVFLITFFAIQKSLKTKPSKLLS